MAKETTYTGTEIGILAVAAPFIMALMVVAVLPFTAWSAFVAMKLWNWFPASYLHLPPIAFWMTFGCMLTINIFKTSHHVKDQKTDWKSQLIGCTVGPAFVLLIGYLVHLRIA